jgi:hypothetical protein
MLPATSNILLWWKMNQIKYLHLAEFACKYLAILATLSSAEKQFSLAGNIITDKRSQLKPTVVDMLCFFHNNL